MKKIVFWSVGLLVALFMSMTVNAKTQDWGGRVIDEKGEPMPFVNVVLLSLPDSAFVQGGMTDEQGIFKIVTSVSDGLFKVSSVGYQTLYIKAAQDLTIQMKEDTQLLKEVVVKGQLPKTHVKGEGISFQEKAQGMYQYGWSANNLIDVNYRTGGLDLTWKFNEARSKYRGSGAGEKQKARM